MNLNNIKIIELLAEEGRLPINNISKHLGISVPNVRQRMKRLVDSSTLKVSGMINASKFPELTIAIAGIRFKSGHFNDLEVKINKLSSLNQINWVCAVTGRYDLVTEFVSSDGISGIYDFVSSTLYKTLAGIDFSDIFVVFKSSNKWVPLKKERSEQE